MNKGTRWLVGLVAVLVVANIVMAASIWLRKDKAVPKPPLQGDARDYLIKTLLLTGVQAKAFDSLRTVHFERMKGYQTRMRDLKDSLFAGLKEPHTAQADSLAKKIGDLQAIIDLETFGHFSQLRQLLTAGQAKKFDSVIQNVLRTLDPRAARPEGGMPRGDRPGERMGPPPGEGPEGPRPPPPGSEPPPQ